MHSGAVSQGWREKGEINKTPRVISRDRFMGDTCVQCEMAGGLLRNSRQ